MVSSCIPTRMSATGGIRVKYAPVAATFSLHKKLFLVEINIHLSCTHSEEVVLTLMCARNTAFGVQKQLVSPCFLWVREVGGQYHTPLLEVCAESMEQWGFRLDSTGPAGSVAGIILTGQEIPGQSTPTGTSPRLSTPRPRAHREEIRINLRSDMLILTLPLPPFTLLWKKRYCHICFWNLRVVNTWKSRIWIMPCPRK